jgi:hypothetical protein
MPGLEKVEGIRFRTISFLGLELPQPFWLTPHRWFQWLADQKFPLLQSAGSVCDINSRDPATARGPLAIRYASGFSRTPGKGASAT